MARESWRLRRAGTVAAALALVAGIPAVLVAGQVRDPWVLASATAAAVVVGTAATVWQDRFQRQARLRDEQAMQVREGCLMLNGQLPKVSQVRSPLFVGVHPAPGAGSALPGDRLLASPRVPVYVPRDTDGQLRELLASGGFVLIVGDSTAGKTRSAYEVMAATLPEHVLIVPHGRDGLRSALAMAAQIRHCVLWLDDLEQFLGVLTRNKITALVEESMCHRVILATLRAAEETRYTSDSIADQSGRQAHRDVREVLEQAERVQMPRLFTPAERRRARARDWDHRIADALAHAETYGIAEYLAAGPELLRDWEDAWNPNTDPESPANPRGAALVLAAVDIRRAGYTAPIPVKLINDTHKHYLAERGGARLRPEPEPEAWAWACQPRRATTALLHTLDDRHVEVFDYLVDVVQRHSQPEDHVPAPVVRAAIDAGDPADADSIAATAYTHGRFDLAEYAYRAAYNAKMRDPGMGAENPGTLASQDKLALVLTVLGRAEEAAIGHREVLATATRTLGRAHVITIASRANLARALRALGHLEEAEAEYRTALEICVEVLGSEHRDTIANRGSLARVLHDLGRLEESEAEHRAVLNICSRIFGPEHPITLTSRGSLASVLHDLGRLDEAEAEHRAVLAIRAKVLGAEHPRTLTSRSLLARVLHELGRLEEAEEEERGALHTRIKVLGPEHPRTLTSRGSLGRILRDLGRLEEAEEEQFAVLRARKRLLGAEHPSTLTSRGSLASVLHDLGRLDEAEAEHRAVLAIRAKVLGPEHPRTLTSRSLLARVLRDLGRIEEAEKEFQVVLEARIRMLGSAHPDTEASRHDLALVQRDKERPETQGTDIQGTE